MYYFCCCSFLSFAWMLVTKQRFVLCCIAFGQRLVIDYNTVNEVTKAPHVFFSSAVLLESSCLSPTTALSPEVHCPRPRWLRIIDSCSSPR